MKYIDIERQLADIFTRTIDASRFAALWGGGGQDLVFAIPMAWFEAEIVLYLAHT
jgi:hypothetical protein